jgi:hypothetical protein
MKLRLPRKIKYLRKARHWHGHGIHSPYLFRLVSEVIEDKKQHPVYRIIRSQKNQITNRVKEFNHETQITYNNIPLQSWIGKKKLFKNIELGYRYGKLMLRLVREFKPSSVFCYGPTFGLNLLYLALADENIPVKTFIPDSSLKQICRDSLDNIPVTNVSFQSSESKDPYIQEFVFINLFFLPEEAWNKIQLKLRLCGDNDVMIIRGIHKSAEMESLWQEVIKEKKVRVSLDLYEIGILLFRKKLQKQHFILRF